MPPRLIGMSRATRGTTRTTPPFGLRSRLRSVLSSDRPPASYSRRAAPGPAASPSSSSVLPSSSFASSVLSARTAGRLRAAPRLIAGRRPARAAAPAAAPTAIGAGLSSPRRRARDRLDRVPAAASSSLWFLVARRALVASSPRARRAAAALARLRRRAVQVAKVPPSPGPAPRPARDERARLAGHLAPTTVSAAEAGRRRAGHGGRPAPSMPGRVGWSSWAASPFRA